MKTRFKAAAAALLFVAGIGVGFGAQKQLQSMSTLYRGKPKQEAAKALLDDALKLAGKDGSWERIGVGRVYYLGGMKAQGQKIFDELLAGKPADSDIYRIARVYQEAGEWQKAKPLFDRYLAANPREEKDLAEVGAYYLLNGDRATAEQMFDRAYQIEREDPWLSVRIAAAYLGVRPQQ
ncbi:MAG TPA: hypothetical protein VEY50_00245 [Lysobacter sp.]|nr:hypothetical protein [Lysobacter sp.]